MNMQNRYGALVTLYPFLNSGKDSDTKNMGDYVQTIAGMQYFPHIDEYVERDAISDFYPSEDNSIPVKVIMNAWWMWNYDKWPPAKIIDPLPISMHISPLHFEEMLSGDGLRWFKEHEPIGCRDNGTIQRLQSKNIQCYYSGCLTLTLGKTYKPIDSDARKGICFADPFFITPKTKKQQIRTLLHFFRAPLTILKLSRKKFFSKSGYNNSFPFRKYRFIKTIMMASAFHRQYSTFFSDSVLCASDYVTHIKIVHKNVDSNASLIADADKMIKYYQTRKLVVTSRIHAALPCLAMETPVIYMESNNVENETWNANRLDGLTNLFRCMQVTPVGLVSTDIELLNLHKVDKNTHLFENKKDWIPIATILEEECNDFIQKG